MYLSNKQLSEMSFNKLAYGVSTGIINEKRLKDYYTSARKTAMSRNARTTKTSEFGTIEKKDFAKLRDLKNLNDLLHEIHDVNKYLNTKSSTITGLKELREEQLKIFHEYKMDFVNESNYGRFVDFLKWFRSSEYFKYFDSNDKEVRDIFEKAGEGATEEDWERLFNEFITSGVDGNGGRTIQKY